MAELDIGRDTRHLRFPVCNSLNYSQPNAHFFLQIIKNMKPYIT